MKEITLHHEAESELRESMLFYETAGGSEVARAFAIQFSSTLHLIREDPLRFPRVPKYPIVQKCRIRGFPYSIYYINRPNDIWAIAVAHGSRQPEFWKRRMK